MNNVRSNSASIQRRISRAVVTTLALGFLHFGIAPTFAAEPVQPAPSLDLAIGNTTGIYTNGRVARVTTYNDSTTVNITETKVTVEAFKTTYVDSTWTAPQVTYPMGSTLMGASMWGDSYLSDQFYSRNGFAYPNVKDSWGALFAYSPIKAANFVDTATGLYER